MWAQDAILAYIDPNTSQHVFNLLGPILAFLATAGGLLATAAVFVRHRIASYFTGASWAKRIAMISIVIGILVFVSLIVCRFIW